VIPGGRLGWVLGAFIGLMLVAVDPMVHLGGP
jgi:hypothetical protein